MGKLKALLILIFINLIYGQELKYCIQVAADKELENLKKSYELIKDFPEARIEKREGLYLLRVGFENKPEDLSLMLRRVRKFFKDAYIKKCELNKELIVFPKKETKNTEIKEVSADKKSLNGEIKSLILKVEGIEKQLKNLSEEIKNINELKEDIKNLSESIKKFKSEEASGKDEKNLIIKKENSPVIYILLGFTIILLLLNFIFIVLLNKKVKRSIIENEAVLTEMLKLVKILNLLSKGYIVKMENGKIYVYDRKKDRWKEVRE